MKKNIGKTCVKQLQMIAFDCDDIIKNVRISLLFIKWHLL